mmetsp:Transcript_11716/g.20760  ORF Transcript_11716/g.20760 Transcript_11716/m.20760 type:complete len:128 (+) Transcript_11716:978-1361(+)
MAPGVDIISADFSSTSGSAVMSGTSMATPHEAGAAALILQSQPQMQPETVKVFLVTSALSGVIKGLKEGSPNLLLHVDSTNFDVAMEFHPVAMNFFLVASLTLAGFAVTCWALKQMLSRRKTTPRLS